MSATAASTPTSATPGAPVSSKARGKDQTSEQPNGTPPTGAPSAPGTTETNVPYGVATLPAWANDAIFGSTQQKNWNAYAAAVAGNSGGEGDNTTTSGAAVSQRRQLLGALANAGNPTTPTPGMTVMGATAKRLGSIK